jgi:hypothetical protein
LKTSLAQHNKQQKPLGDRDRAHLRFRSRHSSRSDVSKATRFRQARLDVVRMALRGDGEYRVSVDQVVETMRSTGVVRSKYKGRQHSWARRQGPSVTYVEC